MVGLMMNTVNEVFRSDEALFDIRERWSPILDSHPELRSRLCTPALDEDLEMLAKNGTVKAEFQNEQQEEEESVWEGVELFEN